MHSTVYLGQVLRGNELQEIHSKYSSSSLCAAPHLLLPFEIGRLSTLVVDVAKSFASHKSDHQILAILGDLEIKREGDSLRVRLGSYSGPKKSFLFHSVL